MKSDDSIRKCLPSLFSFKTGAHNPRTYSEFSFLDPDAENGGHLSWLGLKLGSKARKSVINLVNAVKKMRLFSVNSPCQNVRAMRVNLLQIEFQ